MSQHQIQQSGLTRDGTTRLARPQSQAQTGTREILIFPLITSPLQYIARGLDLLKTLAPFLMSVENEQADTRTRTAESVLRGQMYRRERGQEKKNIFPVQPTTGRIGNLNPSIHTLLLVMIHAYITPRLPYIFLYLKNAVVLRCLKLVDKDNRTPL